MVSVHGRTVDDETRCVHYRTALDVVAIRFPCCGRFYPCHACHAESETHPAERWAVDRFDEPAVLCGSCRGLLTIDAYRGVDGCPRCGAAFNPRCSLHAHLYFEVPPQPGAPPLATP